MPHGRTGGFSGVAVLAPTGAYSGSQRRDPVTTEEWRVGTVDRHGGRGVTSGDGRFGQSGVEALIRDNTGNWIVLVEHHAWTPDTVAEFVDGDPSRLNPKVGQRDG